MFSRLLTLQEFRRISMNVDLFIVLVLRKDVQCIGVDNVLKQGNISCTHDVNIVIVTLNIH